MEQRVWARTSKRVESVDFRLALFTIHIHSRVRLYEGFWRRDNATAEGWLVIKPIRFRMSQSSPQMIQVGIVVVHFHCIQTLCKLFTVLWRIAVTKRWCYDKQQSFVFNRRNVIISHVINLSREKFVNRIIAQVYSITLIKSFLNFTEISKSPVHWKRDSRAQQVVWQDAPSDQFLMQIRQSPLYVGLMLCQTASM